MENGEPSQRSMHEEFSVSIPRGGPIFVPDLVSPLTRVPVFNSEVFYELENLKAELDSCFLDFEDEISVNELKLHSDEDLVTEAMKIAFNGDQEAGASDTTADICSSRVDDLKLHIDEDLVIEAMKIAFDGDQEAGISDTTADVCSSRTEDNERTLDPTTSASCESSAGLESNDVNLKKRNRKAVNKPIPKNKRQKKDKHVDDSYLVKLEPLAKIRQRQKEDKALVELHSFKWNDSGTKKDNAAVSSGKAETLKCVESSTWPVKVKCSRTITNIPIQYPEVVLCVEIYHNKQTWKKSQEFLVLGRQSLTELRDKIHCLTDVVMEKAVEQEKGNANPEIIYADSSGYFLIEDLFCNDMRDPTAIDYSEPILDWLKNPKGEARAKWDYILSGVGKIRKVLLDDKPLSKLPDFRAVDMHKTRFCDLGFRLGAGYLYCHQGDCKHVIVIRDMRLIHPDDVQNQAAYPLLVHQPKMVLKKCHVCKIFKATKVTLDDKFAEDNPCYFCDICYFLLHYSKDGELLYRNFKVYDNLQDYF